MLDRSALKMLTNEPTSSLCGVDGGKLSSDANAADGAKTSAAASALTRIERGISDPSARSVIALLGPHAERVARRYRTDLRG